LLTFYRDLMALRRQTSEVWSLPRETVLIDDARGLYAYRCGAYTVYLNNSAAPARIAGQSGKLVLATDAAATLDLTKLHLPPCGGVVVRSD
jgi:hypothetical protein